MFFIFVIGVGCFLVAFASLSYYLVRIFFVNGVTCPSKARIDGKTVIITGGNTGIGKHTALELARRGGRVIIAARDTQKGAAAVAEIKQKTGNHHIYFHRLDLASKSSIQNFAQKMLGTETHIDILILNAGLLITPYQLTEDGFEYQFGVNHLGHFFLTYQLLDRLKESAPSRVVVVSALAHVYGTLDFNDMMWKKRYSGVWSYCRSKLANVMFARELAKRVSGSDITVCSLHPGVVHTEIGRHMMSGWLAFLKPLAVLIMTLFFKTPEQGAQTTIYCAVAKEVEGQQGAYYDQCKVHKLSKEAMDDERCCKLWEYSEKMLEIN